MYHHILSNILQGSIQVIRNDHCCQKTVETKFSWTLMSTELSVMKGKGPLPTMPQIFISSSWKLIPQKMTKISSLHND